MGFNVTTEGRSIRVGTYGSQSYLAGALLSGYALARLDGWERVGSRWVAVNYRLVDRKREHPGSLEVCRGGRLARTLGEWARYEADGGSVLTDSPQSISLGRKMRPATGTLALLLAVYDPIASNDLSGSLEAGSAHEVGLLVRECAAAIGGYAGGWEHTLRGVADVFDAGAEAGTRITFG